MENAQMNLDQHSLIDVSGIPQEGSGHKMMLRSSIRQMPERFDTVKTPSDKR